MAKIVLGLGLAHTPQMHTPAEEWTTRLDADHKNKALCFRGQLYDWPGLCAVRSGEQLGRLAEPTYREQQHAKANAALQRMAALWDDAAPDVAVIVGNDQHELIIEDLMPAFTVYWGAEIQNVPSTEQQIARKPAGIHIAHHGHAPAAPLVHPGHPELGEHLIRSAVRDGFDVAQSKWMREADQRYSFSTGIPHAFGFVYRNIMRDQVVPNVPVILNTFYPPNQPSAARCLSFGRALGAAVAAWPSDLRVAVIASGGLSHFVIDERFDHSFLAALEQGDHNALLQWPETWFQSGTSECKNWIAAAGALEGSGLKAQVVDYVPCYRSEAGTGTGAGFVVWGN
jgi:hypothetical protein